MFLLISILVMTLYIVGDTWLIVNGYSHFLVDIEYEDDFIVAVVKLYIDLIGIFYNIFDYITREDAE